MVVIKKTSKQKKASAVMCNITNLTLTERTGQSIHKITELKLKVPDTLGP